MGRGFNHTGENGRPSVDATLPIIRALPLTSACAFLAGSPSMPSLYLAHELQEVMEICNIINGVMTEARA